MVTVYKSVYSGEVAYKKSEMNSWVHPPWSKGKWKLYRQDTLEDGTKVKYMFKERE